MLVALALAALFILLPCLLTRLRVIPRKPSPIKTDIYECGLETQGKTWVQFNFRYYFYALVFVVFDVETIFLYPWAVAFNKLGLFALIEMLIFIAILVVGFVYAWRKRVLEWK
ncbi:MAG TPA: NADH-quinone oxidoreductase subunit A [Dehalococcoidia bacterium]|jgi:NADH:ubiquinone oxidoreductase subunit 3 (subunit A)|nr:NADH-quinone oxidoreductase subunit A [Dehalococcoidia bacterium]